MTPYSPQTRPTPPSTSSAVFSSMPKPRRTPAVGHRDDQPPEPAALDEMLVEHAEGEEAEPRSQHQPRRLGFSVTPCTTDSIEVPPRIIGWRHHRRPGARPGDQPAGRLRGADRRQHRRLDAARRQRGDDLALVAAGEIDAAERADPGDQPGSKAIVAAFAAVSGRDLGLEAVGAEHLHALLADRLRLGRGGREDQDAPAGQPVHLGEDRDVAVLEPPADHRELAGPVSHRCRPRPPGRPGATRGFHTALKPGEQSFSANRRKTGKEDLRAPRAPCGRKGGPRPEAAYSAPAVTPPARAARRARRSGCGSPRARRTRPRRRAAPATAGQGPPSAGSR